MTLRFRSALLAIAALSLSGSAFAQSTAESEAQALTLFKEAVRAMEKGDYASACPRFDAAMKLFSSPSTELNIARCFEHYGKVASAWAAYQRVLVLNRNTKDPRRRDALEKLANDASAALQERLPKLRVVVSAAPPELKVTEDGQELPAATFGLPLPADPGEHAIRAEAPGYRTERRTVTLVEGQTTEVALTLVPEGSAAPPPGEGLGPRRAPTSADLPAAAGPARAGGGQRTAGVVVGGIGVAGLGAAGVLGILTLVKVGTLTTGTKGDCPKGVDWKCDAVGESIKKQALTLQTAGFALLGAGGALAIGGVVLYAAAPRAPKEREARGTTVVASVGPMGVSLNGVW